MNQKDTHGTRACYLAGCRCRGCRTANSDYITQYRHKTTTWIPWRAKRAWERWEDELIQDRTKTARYYAQMLQRSVPGVTQRRALLNSRNTNQKKEQ